MESIQQTLAQWSSSVGTSLTNETPWSLNWDSILSQVYKRDHWLWLMAPVITCILNITQFVCHLDSCILPECWFYWPTKMITGWGHEGDSNTTDFKYQGYSSLGGLPANFTGWKRTSLLCLHLNLDLILIMSWVNFGTTITPERPVGFVNELA